MKKPFIDRARISARAGKGGDGCVSFRREKYVPRGGPDGGDGGRGGHVILEADRQQDSLAAFFYAPNLRAEHGGHGQGGRRHGRNGTDRIARVPPGTVVRDVESGALIGELIRDGDRLQIGHGGKGGLGNCHWVTPSHQAPREHTDGDPGELRDLRLELKTIADIGLIGFPNAGKSSLLDALTNARSRIGAYPFTTLHPVIGVMQSADHHSLRIADVPGLIYGAHQGHGLGIDFLRHVERAPSLIVIVDMAATEDRDPVADYRQVMTEIEFYNVDLPKRVATVVANKMDIAQAAINRDRFDREIGQTSIPVSAQTGQGIDALKQWLLKTVPQHRPE